jgi:hypothetical protein
MRAEVYERWSEVAPIWHTDLRQAVGPASRGGTGCPGDGTRVVVVEIEANAFLRHMVRRVVGTLIRVGSGRLAPDAVAGIVEARDRRLAGPTAPPCGLTLVRVAYRRDEVEGCSAAGVPPAPLEAWGREPAVHSDLP